MVTTVSQFRMRYVVEVPDYACDFPTDFAKDTVVCEEALEFTQKHLGESIVDAQEIKLEDAIAQYREEEPAFSEWSDEQIVEKTITKFAEDDEI